MTSAMQHIFSSCATDNKKGCRTKPVRPHAAAPILRLYEKIANTYDFPDIPGKSRQTKYSAVDDDEAALFNAC